MSGLQALNGAEAQAAHLGDPFLRKAHSLSP